MIGAAALMILVVGALRVAVRRFRLAILLLSFPHWERRQRTTALLTPTGERVDPSHLSLQHAATRCMARVTA